MPLILGSWDLANNEIRNALLQNLASNPTPSGGTLKGLVWFNTTTGRASVWNGSAVETLTNLVETVSGGTHVSVNTASKTATITVDATDTNTPSTMVSRDASGNFSAGTVTANLTGLASNSSALGGQTLAQVRDFSLTTGQRTATSAISDFSTAVQANRLDQMTAPTANVSWNSQRITTLADPVNPQDAATKNYADSLAAGLDAKASVRLATAAALPSNNYSNGSSGVGATLTATANGALSVDGTAVVVNNRVLVKNQATAAQNGIYTVTAAGGAGAPYVLTRATDADATAEVNGGMFTFVEAGSTNTSSGWVLQGTGAFTIGTTAQNFTQFTGGSAYSFSNGLNLTGSVVTVVGTANRISVSGSGVDIASNYIGQGSITTLGTITTGTWNGTSVAVANGGTGATTAATARTNLGAMGMSAQQITSAISSGGTFTHTHNLNNVNAFAYLRDASTNAIVYVDSVNTNANVTTLTFGTAISANAYYSVVIG